MKKDSNRTSACLCNSMRPRSSTTSWLNKFKLLALVFMALLSVNAWGESVTIQGSNAPASYNTNTSTYQTVSNIKMLFYNVMKSTNSGNPLQFKKSGGYIQNHDAMPGSITSIVVSGVTSLKVYGGSSEGPTTEITGSNGTYTFSGDKTYFKIVNSGSNAVYPTQITINYSSASSKKTVYLKNTMNWPTAYAYYYSGSYWDATNGSGSNTDGSFKAGGEELTYDNETGLFKVETSNTGYTYVVFTKDKQDGYGNFYNTEAIYCNDNFQYDKVVVVASQTNETKNGTKYYSDPNLAAPQYLDLTDGEGTGFFLPGGFNSWETKGNEMTLVGGTLTYTKDLAANTTYEFKVYNKGKYYGWGNTSGSYHTFTASGSKDVYDGDNNLKIQTSIAGTYTFTFDSSNNTVTVTYPAPPVTVTFKNNGETLTSGGTRELEPGSQIGTLPVLTSSDACDYASTTFVGWSATEIMTKTDVEPTLINASTVVNADITYHAVWAEGTTSTFDAATLENLTEDDEYWVWTENTTGVEMGISAGQRYTSGSPYTFTITKGTSNHFYVEHATAKINTLTVTLSGTDYKIGSVSNGTLTTNGTTQTVTGINATQVMCYATSSQQIRATKIVATMATNYITKCATAATIKTYDGSTLLQTLSDQTLNVSVTPTAPSAKTGYDFVGWNENQEATTGNLTFTPTVAKEYTLYAVWQAHKHTLTYANTEGATIGNGTAAGQVAYGTALTTPTNVTKPGYDFAGWSANLPATMPDENVTITASWNPHTYTATVNQDGGTGITAMTVTYLDNKLVITGTSTKDEFKLTGYRIGSTPIADKDGNLLSNVSGYTNANGEWIGTSNPTIEVEWTAITWTDYLTDCGEPDTWFLYVDGATEASGEMSDFTKTVELEGNRNYGFKLYKNVEGDSENQVWYTDGDGTQNPGTITVDNCTGWNFQNTTPGSGNTGIRTTATGNYTFSFEIVDGYPRVSVTYPTAYQVSYEANGGTGTMDPSEYCAVGGTITLADNAYTKADNHFKGWVANVAVTIGGSSVPAGTLIADGATIQDINSNIILTAQWETKVTALTISQESGIYEIVAGETLQLTLTVTPNDAEYGTTYTWYTSNSATMTVAQNGLVTGVQANTGDYIYVRNNDGVESNHYEITVKSAACDTWGLHMWNKTTFRDFCFSQVGSTTEWRTQQVTLPSNSDEEKLKVLYAGRDGYHTAEWITCWVPTVGYQQGTCTDGNLYAGQDAKGYFRIFSNSEDPNYFLAFQPVYAVMYGVEGQTWQQVEFTDTETANNFYTDIVTVPEGYDSNVKIYAGTSKASGVNFISGRSNTVNMNTITGLIGSGMAGKAGKFKINDNYCNKSNFNLSFERYYRLNYNLDGGAGTGDYTDKFALPSASQAERTFTLETAPTKEGYTFRGWSVSIGGGEATTKQVGETVVLTEDAVATAIWAQNFTVTYDLAGYSTSCSSSTVHYCGETGIVVCEAPDNKTGYTFKGWNTDDIDDVATDYTPGTTFTMPCKDVVFTAHYQADSYTITYEGLEGASNPNNPTSYTIEDNITFVAPDARTGYTFTGWTENGNPITGIVAGTTGIKTITANWSLNSHNVTFDANGHGTAPEGYTGISFGATITEPTAPADVEEDGNIYSFIGWYKEAGCTNAWNFATDVMPDADLTLYAKWSGVTYEDYRTHCCTPLDAPTGGVANNITMTTATLSWGAVSGNNGYQVSADQASWVDVLSGESYNLTGLTAGTHYIYYVRAKGDNNEYCEFGTAAQIPFTTKAALHITYKANDGTGDDVVSEVIEEGASATVEANTFGAPTGMTFNGWNTATDGTGTAYAVGATINPLNADLTLYAQWIGATFNVTYDLAGGTGDCESTTATYNSTFTICSTIPTNGTNAFTGWLRSDNSEIYQPGGTFPMPASDVTLTAQWAASYTVTYVINNVQVIGTSPAGPSYVAQGQPTILPDFDFSCGLYNQFIGWVSAEVAEQDEKIACPALVGKPGDSFTPTGNITLYALFGHDAENLGWVKQTTISSGKYIMSDGTRVMTGFKDESTTTNFLAAITATDDGNGQYATKPTDAAELEVSVLGNGQFTMMLLSNSQYLAATNGSYLNPSATATDACKWELMDGNTQPTEGLGTMPKGSIHSVNYTSVGLLGNTSQVRFTCYDKIASKSVPYLYKLINEGYYTTSPTCEIPTSVTVTYNKNTEDEVEMCENAVLEFDETLGYPHLTEAYTLCAAADVVREGYVLRTWNTAANGTGKNYTPGTVFNELGNNLNLYAQWDRVYTVTLHDNGATSAMTQASEGAAIDLGSGEYAGPCDSDGDGTTDFTWTFVGWTTNNMTLVEYPVCPEVVANPSEYVPVANVDLYAVYSRPIENTTDFAVGVSGAYIVKDNSENWYLGATTNNTKFHFNAVDAESNAIVIKLVENGGSYNVATEAGFVEWEESTYMHYEQLMNNHWTISGSAGNWSMRESVDSRYLCYNGSDKFNLQQSKRTVDLIPTTGTYYFSNPVCQDAFDITFKVRGGDINYGDALEEDYTGLASGKQVTEFPTIDMRADLMDWTFVGWTTVDYNTQHALDDENASTEAPTSTIYRTGGANTFTMPSTNVTLYPVFTSAIANEPMDLENGGDYYVYFTSDQPGYHDPYTDIDGQTIRVYAQQVAGNEATAAFASTTSCANAQLFHFEQHDAEAGKWDIRLRNSAGDGYISNSYLTNPSVGNNDFASQAAQPEGYWTIEQLSDGSFKAQYSVNADTKYFMKGLVSSPETQASATFKCYSEDCDNSTHYYAVYLGSCVERTFSGDPNPLSDLRLEGTVNVTSRTGVAVRAANFLTLKGIKLKAGQEVTISSTNTDIFFSDSKAVNMSKADKPTNPLQITVPESGSMDMPIYVHYRPTATVDGIEQIDVKASYSYETTELKDSVKVKARHLPEQVVIAAKIDNQWYALPANLNGATNPLVTPITVNEATMVAEAPTNCAYKLWPVKTTATAYDRYQEVGERVRFSATNNGKKGLWASDAEASHTTINNYAVIDDIAANPAAPNYEWAISTNDLKVYTLTATGTNNTSKLSVARPTSGGNQGQLVWGTYGTNVTAEVYLLPFTTFTDMQATVIEWFQDKVLVELADGDLWTAMNTASAQTQSRIGSADWATAAAVDYTTYGTNMCTFNTGSLTSSYGENLSVKTEIEETTYQTTLIVPIIIGVNKSVTDDPFTAITPAKYNTMDVVVRDGATLTMNGTDNAQTTFNTITIEPSSKVVVNEDRNLGASLITLRGGYDEIYDGEQYTMSYDEPQLYIGGTSSVTKINYEKRVNLDQMHSLSLPDTIEQNAITYLNGDTIKKGGNLYIDAYDGALRAETAGKSWYYYDATDYPLYRGVGYTISAEPAIEGQVYTILRMPMATGWTKAVPGSEDDSKQVDVVAHGHGNTNIRDNNRGWNCVGNPYMANYGYGEDGEATFSQNLFVDALVKEMVNGQWTGKWVRNNDGVRYVTIPHDDGHGFDQVRVKDAVLKPFRYFFVQIDADGEDLKLTFSKAGHVSAPVRKAMDKHKEIELGILLSNGETSDNCGLLIGEAFNESYEMMNDLGKEIDKALAVYTITGDYKLAFNAMNQQYAEGSIPVGYLAPKAGNYTFSFDSKRYDIDEEVEHLYLLENGMIVADLLNNEYEFETTAGTTEGRFALRVVFGKEVTTDIDGAGHVDETPIKFIYNDKMYILMRGKIYDATGKFVKTIEK